MRNVRVAISPFLDAGALARLIVAVLAAALCAAGGIVALCSQLAPRRLVPSAVVEDFASDGDDTVAVPRIPWTDITAAAGIAFRHVNGAAGEKLLPETMGGGVAFFDYDNDDDPDLLFVNSDFWPWSPRGGQSRPTLALYRNDGGCRFTDVTHDAGLAHSLYGMGVAVGDYDGDGWRDLFLTAVGPDRMLRNERGVFVDVTAEAGVAGADDAWGTSCCWLDYDRDGWLDLFVCNYVEWSREIDLAQPYWVNEERRAYVPPRHLEGAQCCLYRNQGNGRFTDVSAAAGIHVSSAPPGGTPQAAGKALGVAPYDLDDDGWPDLVVANDGVRNFLFRNRRDGTFEEAAELAGIAFDHSGAVNAGMGIDIAAIRNAQSLAVVIGTFAGEVTTFHVSRRGGLLFRDEAVASGLARQTRRDLQFGMLFFDCDLDGRLDLLAANGHIERDIELVSDQQHYEQPPALFWNAGSGQRTEFVRAPMDKTGTQFAAPLAGRGAACADIDGDGDLDLVLTQVAGPPRLLRNDQALGHRWLRVQVQGRGPNRDAVGAVVRLRSGRDLQERTVTAAHGYLSQSELTVTFGLGQTQSPDSLEVIWPDGVRHIEARPQVNRTHVVSPPAVPPAARSAVPAGLRALDTE